MRSCRTFTLTVATAFWLLLLVPAEGQQPRPIPKGAKIYVEKMEQDLDGYIRAEMVKKRVPLVIVTKPEEADIVMTGSSTPTDKAKWHEGWLTPERDKTTGNIMVVERQTGEFFWASEAGDRSWFWGALKRGGHRKVAERLVSNLKKAISQ